MTDLIVPENSLYHVPTFTLLSDGKDISNTYLVLSLVIDRVVNRVPTARIVLRDGSAADATFAASEGADLIPGKLVEIALGYDGNNKRVFKGLIVKHAIKVGGNGDTILTLHCKDQATKLTVGRHSRYFTDSKDSEAIETILKTHSGLSPTVTSTQGKHPEIVQYYTTDWDFILSRAEINGQIVLAEDGTFKVKPPTTSGSPMVRLTYGNNILAFEAEIDARYQYKAVNAKAWNYADQDLNQATGAEPSVSRIGNLSNSQLSDVLGLASLELRHGGRIQNEELKGWANAQLLKSRLAKVRGRIKIEGFPNGKADALVELAGMGARFNGVAYVSGIRHELIGGAWFTYLQLGLDPDWFYKSADLMEKPAAGLLPGVNGLQIGVVVKLQDDPNGEDRVFVKAPIIETQSSQGIWARVATLDAGNQRGSFFRPEIGDEVVLGFLNDDPRDPIVLGMLHSSPKPAPIKVQDTNHHKGFFTRSKMKVTFDDDKKVMTLETPGGNKIIISDEDKGITLKDQNGNTLIMNDSGISMKSPKDITIQATGKLTLKATQDTSVEGLNVNVKANAQFKAQGNAGAEVSTSAIAILKGSLVQIN
jgi:Rhs element Vgr protein